MTSLLHNETRALAEVIREALDLPRGATLADEQQRDTALSARVARVLGVLDYVLDSDAPDVPLAVTELREALDYAGLGYTPKCGQGRGAARAAAGDALRERPERECLRSGDLVTITDAEVRAAAERHVAIADLTHVIAELEGALASGDLGRLERAVAEGAPVVDRARLTERIERIRALHRAQTIQVDDDGEAAEVTVCVHCDGLRELLSDAAAPVLYPCDTIRALDGAEAGQ